MDDDIAQKDFLIAEAGDLLKRRVSQTVEEAVNCVCSRFEEGAFLQIAIEAAIRHLKADFGVDETEEWLREHDPAYSWTSISWRR